eukprot:6506769-Prymnesium_polylepis.2
MAHGPLARWPRPPPPDEWCWPLPRLSPPPRLWRCSRASSVDPPPTDDGAAASACAAAARMWGGT